MNADIQKILESWPYQPELNIRFIKGDDDRDIMQIRLPMGMEQYELTGRPDGQKPHGRESWLEEYEDKRVIYDQNHDKSEKTFSLKQSDFTRLRNEAVIYYYRYLVLFQLENYESTIKDTEHNFAICHLVEHYYHGDDKKLLLQYRPYMIRINGICHSMLELREKRVNHAKVVLEKCIKEIEALPIIDTDIFEFEKARSLKQLKNIMAQVKSQFPDEREVLQEELNRAVELEDYKWAAELRDRLKEMSSGDE